jgi:hypothetical protein
MSDITPQQLVDMWRGDLHPDLVPYLRDRGPLGQVLHHPFIVNILPIPGMHGHDNRRYLQCRQEADDAWAAENWPHYVFTHERAYRTEALQRAIELGDMPLGKAASWKLISQVWIDSENVEEDDDFWAYLWSQQTTRLAMTARERKAFDSLPDPIPLWHGLERRDAKTLGFSWTTSEKVGRWFAKRFGSLRSRRSYLATGLVAKADVKVYLLGRGEFEIIAFPADVTDVKIKALPRGEPHERY